ncbi:MAG: putative toxin-antitoxin system toxin component, PIN family, partial [Gemmatimonadota bacterium]
ILVAAVATRGLSYDVVRIVFARHELVLGEVVLAEVERVLREKLSVPADAARSYVALLRSEATVVGEAPALGIEVRDPDDVAVLEQAAAGEAAVLVTGDHDLLAVAAEVPLRILTPRQFWELLREAGQA